MSESGVIGIHPEVITGAVFFKNETTGLTDHMEVISTWRQAPISCLLIYFLVRIANIQIRYPSCQSRFGESNWILGLSTTQEMEL